MTAADAIMQQGLIVEPRVRATVWAAAVDFKKL